MLRISNGRVVDPSSGTDASLDVLIEGDRIRMAASPADVSRAMEDNGKTCDTLDASGNDRCARIH